jgi:hypothetical protein
MRAVVRVVTALTTKGAALGARFMEEGVAEEETASNPMGGGGGSIEAEEFVAVLGLMDELDGASSISEVGDRADVTVRSGRAEEGGKTVEVAV